jgi:hypothetical protein
MSFRSWWLGRHRDQDWFNSSILTGGSSVPQLGHDFAQPLRAHRRRDLG